MSLSNRLKAFLIDTDIIIDYGRNQSDAISTLIYAFSFGKVYISQMTEMELIIGCRNKSELNTLEKFLSNFKILPVSIVISEYSVELLKKYRLSHNLLIGDSIIASTSSVYNLELISKNQKDYRFIENINLSDCPITD